MLDDPPLGRELFRVLVEVEVDEAVTRRVGVWPAHGAAGAERDFFSSDR